MQFLLEKKDQFSLLMRVSSQIRTNFGGVHADVLILR